MATRNIHFVTGPGPESQATEDVYADNLPSGSATPAAGSVTKAMLASAVQASLDKADTALQAVPAAGTALGGVKQAAAVSNVASPDATVAAGEAPTKAEFDKLMAEANESKRQLNALLASMRSSGFLKA